MKHKLVVANMYRSKNKFSYFAFHQLMTRLPDFDLEFHAIWDTERNEHDPEWEEKFDNLDIKIVSYDRKFFRDYCREYGCSEDLISKFKIFPNIYYILLHHYLRKNNITDYVLVYDDDIILTEEIDEAIVCLKNKLPMLIHEPMNSNCDKVLLYKIFELYDHTAQFVYKNRNPRLWGFNAGIQGMGLEMYDDFISKEGFNIMMSLFEFKDVKDENGKDIWGAERFVIETQQQSFYSIMNILKSNKNPHILNYKEYYVCTNWGHHPIHGELDPKDEYEGWGVNMTSKIIHFIGHTTNPTTGEYDGKPRFFLEMVDKYMEGIA